MPERVAVVDDDPMTRKVVGDVLSYAGYAVEAYADGASAVAAIPTAPPALVLLDLWMPGLDGLAVCRALRADTRTAGMPIVMLTGSTDEEDQVLGFEVGADDYITKPWSVQVLLARIKAALRRADHPADALQVTCGPLSIHPSRHEALLEGKPLNLTPTEFRILLALTSHPERVFTRGELLGEDEASGAGLRRNVDVHIHTLRRKLGRHHGLVDTVWGSGYRLGQPAAARPPA